MITEKELWEWGGYVRAGRTPANLGYAKTTIIYKMMQYGMRLGVVNYNQEYQLDTSIVAELDGIIRLLSNNDISLLNQRYVKRIKPKIMAQNNGVSRKTIYVWLIDIQKKLDLLWNECNINSTI